MFNVLSEVGIHVLDFIQISAVFLLTMLLFFGIKKKRYFWLRTFSLVTLTLQCLLFILFRAGLGIKIFAFLMLLTTLIVKVTVDKRNGLGIPKSDI